MRVISGSAKGRKLKSVPGGGTRPITDRAKEALFNIFQDDIVRSRFLDLYAGTGQVGIEALSRAAMEAVFVERASVALRTIQANLAHTELSENAQVVRADVFEYLRREPSPFDYVYIAPPQYREMWSATLHAIDGQPQWLADDGWAIAQIHPKEFQELAFENLVLFDQRRYGGVMLCFYTRED